MADFKLLYLILVAFCHSAVLEKIYCPRLCKDCKECIDPVVLPGKFGDYEAFIGIPYAEPPVGALRFKDPQPPTKFPKTLTADDKPKCLQRYLYDKEAKMEGDEDCLYLNVYRPLNSGFDLPVLVYFPHSDFMYGSGARSEIAPDIIMSANNVVVVVAQYRVGLMGFFSTGDENVPGNMGLKDQQLALEWVVELIDDFNGDNYKITVYGDATVFYQLINGYIHFNQVIITGSYFQSYFEIHGALSQEEAAANAKRYGAALGYEDIGMEELVKKMRDEEADVLLNGVSKMMGDFYFPFHVFGPTLELEDPNAFLSESPWLLWQEWEDDVKILIGYSPFYGEQMVRALEKLEYTEPMDTREAIKRLTRLDPLTYDRMDEIIARYGLSDDKEFKIAKKYRQNYVDLFNDRYYAKPLQRMIYDYNENKYVKRKRLYLFEIMFDDEFNDGEVSHLLHNFDSDHDFDFEYNEDFVTFMREFIEDGIPRTEVCFIDDEDSHGESCPHVDFYYDFLYEEYRWNTSAADFWSNL